MNKKTYAIGQILFVVLNKKNQVYPMQIIEIITKKTMNGEDVRYLLQAGAEKESNVFLDQIDGEVFDSAEEAKSTLIQRASNQISKLVLAALQKSKEWYKSNSDSDEDKHHEPQMIQDLPDLSQKSRDSVREDQDGFASVMMSDGSLAKIKLPSV